MSESNRRRQTPPTEREIIRAAIVMTKLNGKTLHASQHLAIRGIMEEDFTAVGMQAYADARRAGDRLSDAMLERGLKSLRDLYVLAALDALNAHVVLNSLDLFFRAHICVDTQAYMRFWFNVAGPNCIAHRASINIQDSALVRAALTQYETGRSVMERYCSDIDTMYYPETATKADLVSMLLRLRSPQLQSVSLRPDQGLPVH